MKKIIAIITIGLFTISAFAQNEQPKHEFSIYAGGGISSLEYDLERGDHKMGLGGLAGIGYNFFFHYNWSIGIGAEFSFLQAKADMRHDPYTYYTRMTGRNFEMILDSKVEETQQAFYVNVPLRLQFQTDVYKRNKFYAAIGAKVGFPVMDAKAKYEGEYTIKGYSLNEDGKRLNPDQPYVNGHYKMDDYGFHSGGASGDREFSLGDLNIIGTAELGMKWPVGKTGKNAWYTGVFVDYGFSDVRPELPEGGRPGYVNADGSINSVIESNLVDKVNTLTIGAKVAFAFGFGSKHIHMGKVVEEKPFEGITADQMDQILGKNTGVIVDAMDRNFNELFDKLKKEEPELFEPVVIDDAIVQFDFDKADVKTVYYPDIDTKIAIMKKYPEIKMTLIGHTDNRGTEQYNQELGLKRAQHVKDYMIHRGITADRLFVESRGETQPLYPNTTDDNRYKNRRVEFELRK